MTQAKHPSGLPFKTLPKPAEVTTVGDAEVGILPIKKLGCLTVNEREAVREAFADKDEINGMEYQLITATTLIQSRIDPSWTLEKTKAQLDDPESGIRYPLVEALSNFYSQEGNRWQPESYLLKLEGESALETAKSVASKSSGSVVAIPSYQDEMGGMKTYYVFAEKSKVPDGFTILGDKKEKVISQVPEGKEAA